MFKGVVLVCVLALALVPTSAKAKAPKEPWFLHSAKARKAAGERGFSLQLRLNSKWAPSNSLRSFAQGSIAIRLTQHHLLLGGFVDGLILYPIPSEQSASYPALQRAKGSFLFDQGSEVSVQYTWAPPKNHRWGQSLRLFYFPFTDHVLVMGEEITLLSYPQPGDFEKNPPPTYGTFGVGFEWNWVSCWTSMTLHHFGKQSQESSKTQKVFASSWRGSCELNPTPPLRFLVQGSLDQQPLTDQDLSEQVRWSGGIHLMGTYRVGKRPTGLVFLHRRVRDPRSAQRKLPLLTAPHGIGTSILIEGGYQPQEQRNNDLKKLQWQYGFALAGRIIGQVHWFQWELMASYRTYRWLLAKRYTYNQDESITKARGLTVLGLAIQIQPQPTLTLGLRLDLRFPGLLPSLSLGRVENEKRYQVTVEQNQHSWVREGMDINPVGLSALNVRWSPFASLHIICEGLVRADPHLTKSILENGVSKQVQYTMWFGQVSLLIQAQF